MLTKPEHEIAYQDLVALVNKHAGKLTSLELLAVASNMLGKLVAMQDQRYVTGDKAMRVVQSNLEIGNKQALAELMKTGGTKQ